MVQELEAERLRDLEAAAREAAEQHRALADALQAARAASAAADAEALRLRGRIEALEGEPATGGGGQQMTAAARSARASGSLSSGSQAHPRPDDSESKPSALAGQGPEAEVRRALLGRQNPAALLSETAGTRFISCILHRIACRCSSSFAPAHSLSS